MTTIRKTYQRAILMPIHHVEQLWRDYENFENSVSRALVDFFVFSVYLLNFCLIDEFLYFLSQNYCFRFPLCLLESWFTLDFFCVHLKDFYWILSYRSCNLIEVSCRQKDCWLNINRSLIVQRLFTGSVKSILMTLIGICLLFLLPVLPRYNFLQIFISHSSLRHIRKLAFLFILRS